MRKLKQTLGIAATVGLLCGCGSLGSTGHRLQMNINRGMPKTEVQQLLGTPNFRSFNNRTEQWEYQSSAVGQYTQYLIVQFENDTVRSMYSFNELSKGRSLYPSLSYSSSEAPFKATAVIGSIDETEFRELYQQVADAIFKEDVLSRELRLRKVSCTQCIALLSLYRFDSDKLKMLNVLKDHIADTLYIDKIIDTFDLSSRNEAKRILEN